MGLRQDVLSQTSLPINHRVKGSRFVVWDIQVHAPSQCHLDTIKRDPHILCAVCSALRSVKKKKKKKKKEYLLSSSLISQQCRHLRTALTIRTRRATEGLRVTRERADSIPISILSHTPALSLGNICSHFLLTPKAINPPSMFNILT